MGAKLNLLNQQFGKLTVIAETPKRKNNSVVWKCQCECGNIIEFSTKELRNGGVQMCSSCGNDRIIRSCAIKDIIGERFGYLTVVSKSDKRQGGKIAYKCLCDCGNITYRTRTDLKRSAIPACGPGCPHKLLLKKGQIINNREIININSEKNKTNQRKHFYQVRCMFCNREYDADSAILNYTFSCGCQKSIGEFNISQVLNSHGILFKREYIFAELPNRRYDFALLDPQNQTVLRLIEFDGEQHFLENVKNTGWNNNTHYEKTRNNDMEKNKFALNHNIPLVRIPYWQREHITLDLLLGNKYLIISEKGEYYNGTE